MKLIPDSIYYDDLALMVLRKTVYTYRNENRKVFILTDENTFSQCLPIIRHELGELQESLLPITVKAGEKHKNIEAASYIWSELARLQAGRDALLINLGGGMVTDLGGFAASCYKRGIKTIHIPTTLLGMVDAAIGGKTGVDLSYFKNIVGTFYAPSSILIIPKFLHSLGTRQIRSGLAEVIKYGFISRPELLDNALDVHAEHDWTSIINTCIEIKTRIVQADPTEAGLRKILNFGHTIGHALESLALEKQHELLHGEAIAAGMICELYLSTTHTGLHEGVLEAFVMNWRKMFFRYPFADEDINRLIELIRNDKKNLSDQLLFTLISSPGNPLYDVIVEDAMIIRSLKFYQSILLQS